MHGDPLSLPWKRGKKGIQSAIDRAHSAKDAVELILRKKPETLAKADAESERIIREGKEYGEKLRSEMTEKAQEEAKKMIAAAKEEIEQEKHRALDVLRKRGRRSCGHGRGENHQIQP